jgi:ADP-heptose:LPS heptosyltransferase
MKNTKLHLLAIRTSAMGDVALTTPVIRGLRKQYPDTDITIMTRSVFAPFYYSIDRLEFLFPDFKKRHKGLSGIINLFIDLRKLNKFDYVIDLHDVLRSKILKLLFRLSGVPVSVINKGRGEKGRVITSKNKVQLRHSVDKYYDVFAKAGFPVLPEKGPWIIPTDEAQKRVSALMTETGLLHIGVAPYAKHSLKVWPEENMISLLKMIAQQFNVKFWVFGGKEETKQLVSFQNRVPGSVLVAGTLNLDEELAMISRLNFMISMDSSNMHMAALAGIRTISIWGGTDPLTGFGAWQQPDSYAIRIPVEDLTCRPCTVYGKGICRRGDFACMNWLTPKMVFNRMIDLKIL